MDHGGMCGRISLVIGNLKSVIGHRQARSIIRTGQPVADGRESLSDQRSSLGYCISVPYRSNDRRGRIQQLFLASNQDRRAVARQKIEGGSVF
jgi:hypothetical protein